MIGTSALNGILEKIKTTDYINVSSTTQLMEYAFALSQWMAYSGQMMAEAKRDLHTARRQAMINLIASLKANTATLSAQLQRDYVMDLCADEASAYELAERTNKACTHTLDMVRSCLSTLKEEMKMTT